MSGPIIVQSDRSILLEVEHPSYKEARDELLSFAELIKSPEHIHTYRLTPISLWNAASMNITETQILKKLQNLSKYPIPQNIRKFIKEQITRYGKLELLKSGEDLKLVSEDPLIIKEILNYKKTNAHIKGQIDKHTLLVKSASRGFIKQEIIKLGYPVKDLAGYTEGAYLPIAFRDLTLEGKDFHIRDYQKEAVSSFYAGGSLQGGSGTIVMPCGAGKTIVGMGVMELLSTWTLIVVTNITAARQWISELIDKTTIDRDSIAEYSGETKAIKPITVATYQILTYRKSKKDDFLHFKLFDRKEWGLIVYDEVHLLPAPIFRITAQIQAKRRLGLTATLVREDGREGDVFSLIGPKKYDIAWRRLEESGFIARAICTEIRIPLNHADRLVYATSDLRPKFRIASENIEKIPLVKYLIKKHKNSQILIIGQYLRQLEEIADIVDAPLIQGSTPNSERIEIYDAFRRGDIKVLVVSKVANFAIDLPDANVAIQISGTFGSRQEEAQRLGRILRPKKGENIAYFYTIVSEDTSEQRFSANRQLFLTEQGYEYRIVSGEELLEGEIEPINP
jgi:DNA excision repair protein ERCC-3